MFQALTLETGLRNVTFELAVDWLANRQLSDPAEAKQCSSPATS